MISRTNALEAGAYQHHGAQITAALKPLEHCVTRVLIGSRGGVNLLRRVVNLCPVRRILNLFYEK